MFADNITWHNDSLREEAEAECGDDHECLFDVASTNDLSVGIVTKDISVQLVNESNALGKSCKIECYLVTIHVMVIYFQGCYASLRYLVRNTLRLIFFPSAN